MERAARICLIYAVAFVAFMNVPAAFRTQAPWPFPTGFYWQEVLDLFTPLVLIPLSWLLCSFEDFGASRRERLIFLILAALWVEGQGMHLAANSIGRSLENDASTLGALTHYYDETLSHYLWHAAMDGLWALAIVRALAHPYRQGRLLLGLVGPALVLLGVSWWAVVVESGTALLDLPFMAVALAATLVARRELGTAPVAVMLSGTFAVSLTLVAVWAAAWGGRLPQFSEVHWFGF